MRSIFANINVDANQIALALHEFFTMETFISLAALTVN